LNLGLNVRSNLYKPFPLLFATSLFATLSLWSGEIIQPQFNFDVNIWVYRPLGQTFTAEDSKISSIGFEVEGYSEYSSTQLTYELREGVGTNGQLLASANFTLPTTFSGYADADFSSVTLTVGQLYTVMIFASNPSFLVGYNALVNYNGRQDRLHRRGVHLPGRAKPKRRSDVPDTTSSTDYRLSNKPHRRMW